MTRTTSPHRFTMAPIRVAMSRKIVPGWSVTRGQPGTSTDPPVTIATARNTAALVRSGSIVSSRPCTGPGWTTHRHGSGCSTRTPRLASMVQVMSMWGREGRAAPVCRRSIPCVQRGAASSRAETNWLDWAASISTTGPPRRAGASTVRGRVACGECPTPRDSYLHLAPS